MDGGLNRRVVVTGDPESPPLPDYLVETYTWAYLTPTSIRIFDNPVVVAAILWGNFWRLVRTATCEFAAGQHVLQAASVYGNLSETLAQTVGPAGRLEVIDVAPIQVAHCRAKLAGLPQAEVRLADAADPGPGLYDGVCCFFLLHEIPDERKGAVVDALLARVCPGGRVVFVDYHKAAWFHPLRPVMAGVFRWLEPFAQGLIDREIQDFARHPQAFTWRKETYFGGLYQKVVAIRKPV